MQKDVRFGLTGLGGYAGVICDVLLRASDDPQLPLVLQAACEPCQQGHEERIQQLQARGVAVLPGIDELLAQPVDAVWLPVPIQLHRPFAEQALAAGKAVVVEKPVAGCIQDLDAMIAARDKAGLPVAVGFQDIYEPVVAQLKQTLLAGRIGKVRSATVAGCWPRDDQYYQRNNWAGRLRLGDTWVLDSPANNAMAHFLHVALFILGPTMGEAASPVAIEAELYRANDIENYDTCSMRLHFADGGDLLVLLTHACGEQVRPVVHLEGEKGSLCYEPYCRGIIKTDCGREELPVSSDVRQEMARRVANLVADPAGGHLVATLEMARAHTLAISGASAATPIENVPADEVRTLSTEQGTSLRVIPDIEQVFEACVASGSMLHESGRFPWTSPAGRMDLRGYNCFEGPAEARRHETPA